MPAYGQPVISRETRRLLVTILVSLTALWVLARVRFQERPPSTTPVPAVLAQLRPTAAYADLASAIADVRPGILAAVSTSGGGAVLRISGDSGITLAPDRDDTVVASDRATGLAIVRRLPSELSVPVQWVPRLLDYPRYLVAVDVAGANVALRPVFVSGLFPTESALWTGEVWGLSPATPITPGTFLFSIEGALVGMCVNHQGVPAIVPAPLLSAAWERLQAQRLAAGDIGIAIQPLTPAIASAVGAASGVVVSAVDPTGAAEGALVPTEVIEAVDGQNVPTPDHWRARIARARAGEVLTLRLRSRDGVREVPVVAAPLATRPLPAEDPTLGLTLRTIPKVGAQVLTVARQSAGARAGLQGGDVITVVDGSRSPTSSQLMRSFALLPDNGSLLLAVTRGQEHRVLVLQR